MTHATVVIVDDSQGSGATLAERFQTIIGRIAFYLDPRGLTVSEVIDRIVQLGPDLVVSDTNWTKDCDQEGLELMRWLEGRYPFILTSGSPRDPQSLISAANDAGAYFMDRAAGAKFIVTYSQRLLTDGKLDQEELNNFREWQNKYL